MKLIIKEGIYSRNSPKNTMDAIILAVNNPNIDGISITIQMTQDGILVVYPDNTIMHKNINKIPYKQLTKYNVGTRIKKHSILKLEDVLQKMDGSSKKLLIELVNCDNNLQLVESVITLASKYPDIDIYLNTCVKEDILYLKEIANTCRIGATIKDSSNYFWNLDLDFYIIDEANIDSSYIHHMLDNNRIIMYKSMDTVKQLSFVENNFQKYIDNIYIITNHHSKIIKYLNNTM